MLVQDVLSMVACPWQAQPFMSFHILVFYFCISRKYDVSEISCLSLLNMKCLRVYYKGIRIGLAHLSWKSECRTIASPLPSKVRLWTLGIHTIRGRDAAGSRVEVQVAGQGALHSRLVSCAGLGPSTRGELTGRGSWTGLARKLTWTHGCRIWVQTWPRIDPWISSL